jgi:hypothetical protein
MSDTQNTYSSSNLYPFGGWANTTNGFGPSSFDVDFNNLSPNARKRVKFLFNDLPKDLEEAGKSYLGLTRIFYS